MVCKQIVDLEGCIFEINGLHVSFHFEELPNDMKMQAMLAMLGGELSNSATFFSTFANVSTNYILGTSTAKLLLNTVFL